MYNQVLSQNHIFNFDPRIKIGLMLIISGHIYQIDYNGDSRLIIDCDREI